MNENGTVMKICKSWDFRIQLSFVLFFGDYFYDKIVN